VFDQAGRRAAGLISSHNVELLVSDVNTTHLSRLASDKHHSDEERTLRDARSSSAPTAGLSANAFDRQL
jgi:hypothetical protein